MKAFCGNIVATLRKPLKVLIVNQAFIHSPLNLRNYSDNLNKVGLTKVNILFLHTVSKNNLTTFVIYTNMIVCILLYDYDTQKTSIDYPLNLSLSVY